MSNTENKKHSTADVIKIVVVAIVLIALLSSVVMVALKLSGVYTGEQSPVSPDGVFILEPVSSQFMNLSDVSAGEDMGIVKHLQAEVKPAEAVQSVVWEVAFADPNAEWALDKTAEDYVVVTPDRDNSCMATVECLQPFGAQIMITVKSSFDSTKSAFCTLDYVNDIAFDLSCLRCFTESPTAIFDKLKLATLTVGDVGTIRDSGALTVSLMSDDFCSIFDGYASNRSSLNATFSASADVLESSEYDIEISNPFQNFYAYSKSADVSAYGIYFTVPDTEYGQPVACDKFMSAFLASQFYKNLLKDNKSLGLHLYEVEDKANFVTKFNALKPSSLYFVISFEGQYVEKSVRIPLCFSQAGSVQSPEPDVVGPLNVDSVTVSPNSLYFWK